MQLQNHHITSPFSALPASPQASQPWPSGSPHFLLWRSVASAANAASLNMSMEPATATRALLRSCSRATNQAARARHAELEEGSSC